MYIRGWRTSQFAMATSRTNTPSRWSSGQYPASPPSMPAQCVMFTVPAKALGAARWTLSFPPCPREVFLCNTSARSDHTRQRYAWFNAKFFFSWRFGFWV